MKKKLAKITKDTLIAEAVERYPELGEVLAEDYGFHCIGCMASEMETIEQGAMVHGFTGKETKKGLLCSYEDNGVGIPPSDKTHIFTRGFGGHTGLGMFLSREILAITGLTIIENGEFGKGARFEITVPPGAYRLSSKEG